MKGQTNAKLASKGIPGESVNITLLTNQESHSDLIGAVITVSYGGVDTEYVWEGSEVTVKIPAMTEYNVSVSEVEGYATPEGFSATSQMGYSRKLEMTYQCELVTVNVSADTGSVSGYEVTISTPETLGQNKEYIRLECIKSTGTQYIDTLVTAQSGLRTVIDCSVDDVSSTSNIFGAYSNSNRVYIHYDSSEKLLLGYGAYNKVSYNLQAGIRHVFDAEFTKGKQSLSIDGNIVYTGTDSTERTTNCSAYLCAMNSGSSASLLAKMTIYSCKIYSNEDLVRDYIPAMRSDGVAGLYDKQNDLFYPSVGSSKFDAGDYTGMIDKMTTSTGVYKIPYGTLYIVKANNVSRYITPKIQTFTASQPLRILNVIYETIPLGVFAQGVSGRLYTKDEWAEQETLNGVAIVTENCSFLIQNIAEKDLSILPGTSLPIDMPYYFSPGEDYDGKGNTNKLLTLSNNTSYAAGYCYSCVTPNGQHGYLPSYGECIAYRENRHAISEFFSPQSLFGNTIWSSTIYARYASDYINIIKYCSASVLSSNMNILQYAEIDSDMPKYKVFPFFPLEF